MTPECWNPRKLAATRALWLLFAITFALNWLNLWERTTMLDVWQGVFFFMATVFSLVKE